MKGCCIRRYDGLAIAIFLVAAIFPMAETGFSKGLTTGSEELSAGHLIHGGNQVSSCLFRVYKEGDPVLGGYKRGDRAAGDFDPNKGPHGPHVTSEILKDRKYYYYFEVQAAIANIGSRDDWSFNQRVDRSGWLTLDLGQQRESARVDMALHHAADNPDAGDFVWDSKGYHYASAHGIDVEWPTADGKKHPVKNADILWKFGLSGHHETDGRQDTICTPLTFRIHLIVKSGQASWTVLTGEDEAK